MTQGEVPGMLYGLSKKGWIDRELFGTWFISLFLKYALPTRPLLLLMDGHSSHYCPDTIRMAAEERIIIFALPPNTTHITQPLDKGCFGPLKLAWRNVCHQYMASNQGKVVNRYCFSPLFAQAWMKSMTMANITGGFRVTGVYPLDRNAFILPGDEYHSHIDLSLAASNGLKYIPLYSPACHHTRRHTIAEVDNAGELSSREPSPEAYQSQNSISEQFTAEEIAKFERRYDNGYDLHSDHHYNLWLKVFHSPAECSRRSLSLSSLNDVHVPDSVFQSPADSTINKSFSSSELYTLEKQKAKFLTRRTVIHKFLNYPTPVSMPLHHKSKSSARVLTSAENLRLIDEKEKQKRQIALEKEERKQQREEKKCQKEAEKLLKEEKKRQKDAEKLLKERQKEAEKKQGKKQQARGKLVNDSCMYTCTCNTKFSCSKIFIFLYTKSKE